MNNRLGQIALIVWDKVQRTFKHAGKLKLVVSLISDHNLIIIASANGNIICYYVNLVQKKQSI